MKDTQISQLSDRQLHHNIKQLVCDERKLLTIILKHLAEVQKRRLFCSYQCSSLFDYAVSFLGYSEGQAHRRITAMRLILEVPEVEKKIETGELSLTNAAEAQRFFRNEGREAKKEFTVDEKTGPLARPNVS